MKISQERYGYTANKEEVIRYRLINASGAYVDVINYGCRIINLCVYDKDHELRNVCLGYDQLEDYLADDNYFGAAVGRCANRIEKAQMTIGAITYSLDENEGENHLHGGVKNFSNSLWIGKVEEGLVLTRAFEDGESGYPGVLEVAITYNFSDEQELRITYEARSTKDTIVNFTNHTYFNLDGDQGTDIRQHSLKVEADYMSPINEESIPTGERRPVEGTPFDFREERLLGEQLDREDEQLQIGAGIDHNYIIREDAKEGCAKLYSANSGIEMTCKTDQPDIQIYTANYVDCQGRQGRYYNKRSAVCLETQAEPNAVNTSEFSSVFLKKEEDYQTTTSYTFEVVTKK